METHRSRLKAITKRDAIFFFKQWKETSQGLHAKWFKLLICFRTIEQSGKLLNDELWQSLDFPFCPYDTKASKQAQDLNIPHFLWKDVSDKQEVGGGSLGTVYHGQYNGRDIVVKRLRSGERQSKNLFEGDAHT